MNSLELFRRSIIVGFIIHSLAAHHHDASLVTDADAYTEGAILRASCSLPHRPAAKVSWYVNDKSTNVTLCDVDDDGNPPTSWRSPASPAPKSFCMQVSRDHHGKTLRCTLEDPALQQPVNITKRICVKYADLALDSSSYNVGDKITATCIVSNSLRANIAWYVDGVFVKNATNLTMSYDTRLEKVAAEYRAYVTGEEDNGAEISCRAEVDSLRPVVMSTKMLNVQYPPSGVTLTVDKATEYQEGDSLKASCVVRSNPVANVTWYFGGDVIQINEQGFLNVDNWTVTTGFTKLLTRNDDGKTVRCDVYYGRNHSSSYIRIRVGSTYEMITSVYVGSLFIVLGLTTIVILCYALTLLVPISSTFCCLLCTPRGPSVAQQNVRRGLYEDCDCPMARRPLPTLPTDMSRYSNMIQTNDVTLRYGDPRLRIDECLNLPRGIAAQCREYDDTEYLLPRPRAPVEYLRILPDQIYHQIPAVPRT